MIANSTGHSYWLLITVSVKRKKVWYLVILPVENIILKHVFKWLHHKATSAIIRTIYWTLTVWWMLLKMSYIIQFNPHNDLTRWILLFFQSHLQRRKLKHRKVTYPQLYRKQQRQDSNSDSMTRFMLLAMTLTLNPQWRFPCFPKVETQAQALPKILNVNVKYLHSLNDWFPT